MKTRSRRNKWQLRRQYEEWKCWADTKISKPNSFDIYSSIIFSIVQIFLLWKNIERERVRMDDNSNKKFNDRNTPCLYGSFSILVYPIFLVYSSIHFTYYSFFFSLYLFFLVCVQPVFIDAHSSMVTLWLSRTTFSLLSSLARSNSIERHSRAKWRGYSLQFDGIDDGDNIVSESVAFFVVALFCSVWI